MNHIKTLITALFFAVPLLSTHAEDIAAESLIVTKMNMLMELLQFIVIPN